MRLRNSFMIALACSLCACTSLLPDSTNNSRTPWKTYAEAEAAFSDITPGKTSLAQLKAMGVDPAISPNVAILSHADLLQRLQPMMGFEGKTLDPAIKQCVMARSACFAYRVEQKSLDRERVGNFWLDFLNFKRVTQVSGWQFDALILISHGTVIYKSWSGKPNIRETEQENRPLGPLQGLGSQLH